MDFAITGTKAVQAVVPVQLTDRDVTSAALDEVKRQIAELVHTVAVRA